MDDENAPVVCRSCHRTYPLKDIKLDENKKAYVCTNCYTSPQPMTFQEKVDNEGEKKTFLQNMIKYNCPKCKYHFQRPKDKIIKECPYCGNKIVEKANKDSAEKVLHDVEEYD